MDYLGIGEGVLAAIGAVSVAKGIYHSATSRKKPRGNNIGRIVLRGPIQEYSSVSSPLGRQTAVTPEGVEELVKSALFYDSKGLIFEIDSPGGAVVPSKEIADYIKRIEIPTVALVKGHAASGAYWIASACDGIVANEYSMIGSIGVIMPHLEFSRLAEKLGIKYDGVQSGDHKDLGNPFRPINEDERRILQQELHSIHAGFIQAIAENREMEVDEVRKLANGLTYHGAKALDLGLVDAIGNTDEAVELLEELGEFKHDDVLTYSPSKKGLGALLESFGVAGYSFGRNIGYGLMETVQQCRTEIK